MAEKQTVLAVTGFRLWWLGVVALALFLYLVRSIIPPFLIGVALAYVLEPVVSSVQQRWRIPHAAAVFLVYLILLGPLIVVLILLGPRFFDETRQLIVRAPGIMARLIEQAFGPGPYDLMGTTTYPRQISDDLVGSARQSLGSPSLAIHLASMLVDFFLNVFLALIVSIYLLLDSARFIRLFYRVIPAGRRLEVQAVGEEIHRTLARFLRGEMFLVGLVSAVSFLGLELIFHLRYALPLAVATGLLEIVPILGPIAAGTIAAALALSEGGPGLALGVIVFYVIIRQVEDQVVMPFVVGRAVELHPLVVLFAVLAGGALLGFLGTLLAVPIAASIKVMLTVWLPAFSEKEQAPAIAVKD